ncbi:hypothetical protein C176_14652 [Viridibacillus arenosi FSL R5-213]|uniref:Uncharacterized protein n=1 Tax=Viridibacillus arenosi FSL R5-213 TaxID=1227360 RepID=W4EPS2_9BACL|nr:hypothetical protein C176_14652 [Viridibacillus arenosi FSL R5-213]
MYGERTSGDVAEGANNKSYESLRQKDSYGTQLWRELYGLQPPKRTAVMVKLSGAWTENPNYRISLSIFLCPEQMRRKISG